MEIRKDTCIDTNKEELPEFSVLMTVYKQETPSFLNRSLESLELQTILPTKIIIVADGPLTPKLDTIIEKHQKSQGERIQLIRLPKNKGRGYASKIGIDVVETEWVARMDSDDVSLPDRFEKQLKAIKKHPEVSVIGSYVSEFEDDEDIIIGQRKVPITNKEIKDYARYRNPINNPSVMFKISAVRAVGGYPQMNILEDYDLWANFIANDYQLMNLDESLVKMRVGSGMYSRRGGIKFLVLYLQMKNKWRKMGVGDKRTEVVSDVIMTVNTLMPNFLRKLIYRRLIHKK